MSKRTFIWLAALVAALFCGLACLIVLMTPAPTEPFYQGKRLTYWLDRFGPPHIAIAGPNGTSIWQYPRSAEEARAALLHAGSNAVPTLLRLFQTKGRESEAHLRKTGGLHPGYKQEAMFGFQVLGPQAASVVPEMIKTYDQGLSLHSQGEATLVLAWIGPAAKAAIPSLLRGTVSTNASSRNQAIRALTKIHSEPELVVPVLIKALALPDPKNGLSVRVIAVYALAVYGPDAKAAVPTLVALRGDPEVNLLPNFFVLNTLLELSNLDLNTEPNLFDVSIATMPSVDYALKKIDPEAAAKAGVK